MSGVGGSDIKSLVHCSLVKNIKTTTFSVDSGLVKERKEEKKYCGGKNTTTKRNLPVLLNDGGNGLWTKEERQCFRLCHFVNGREREGRSGCRSELSPG